MCMEEERNPINMNNSTLMKKGNPLMEKEENNTPMDNKTTLVTDIKRAAILPLDKHFNTMLPLQPRMNLCSVREWKLAKTAVPLQKNLL